MEIRIGIGYDSHKFVKGKKLFIGGIEIPFDFGLLGHSDGDVAIHALIDSVLGAAHLPNLGVLFPDDSLEYKDVDSKKLLKVACKLLAEKGFQIVNIDGVLILELPKLSQYFDLMNTTLAEIMGINPEQVNFKAKTNEGMGFVGRGEGVACIVVSLVAETKQDLSL